MIAHVYVDTGVRHLDRPFDYEVPPDWADQVAVGIRVKVRFNSRLLSGLIVGLAQTTEQATVLPLARIVSEEVVLPKGSIELIRAVADHCAGTFMDVARLAIPPRYAREERSQTTCSPGDPDVHLLAGPMDEYPAGSALRVALREGRAARVAWNLVPVHALVGQWHLGLADAAADVVSAGRDALIVVPDAKDCAKVLASVCQRVDPLVVVSLSADMGPQRRYRSFLSAARGQARVVVGTRAAIYTPMRDLGLIAVWDDADNSLAEPHSPYPALRDVAAIRASQAHCALIFAGYSRSVPVHQWVDQGWLTPLGLPPTPTRRLAPLVRVASHDDQAGGEGPMARASRLPHDVFVAVHSAMEHGPVLVWVPWLGHRRNFICRSCGAPMRCACGGAFAEVKDGVVACSTCGRVAPLTEGMARRTPSSDAQSGNTWVCQCGSHTWKAITTGSARWAQELAKAFPKATIRRSDSTTPLATVPDEPAIIISTAGSEPDTPHGYQAAIILDAYSFLTRPDIRAGEEAVRRWLSAAAMVVPADQSGTVVLVGPANDRTIQAVLRMDPVGFAARELGDRREAGFPPATRMAVFTSDEAGIACVTRSLTETGYVSLLGPVEVEDGLTRLIARVDAQHGEDFAEVVGTLAAARGSTRSTGKLQVRLDPDWGGTS